MSYNNMEDYVYSEINYGEFYFDLQSKSDATIILSTIPENQSSSKPEYNSVYEVVLGSVNNTQSYISIESSTCVTVNSEGILNEKKSERFWIKWGAGFISVGLSIDNKPFIKCPYKNKNQVRYIRFESVHDALWTLYKPPSYNTAIKSIKTGPCVNKEVETFEINFGVIYFSVFGRNSTIQLCSEHNVKFEVEIILPEKCSINAAGVKKIQKMFPNFINQKIQNSLDAKELIKFWISWFEKQISFGLNNNTNIILISVESTTNLNFNSIGKLTKQEVFFSKWHGVNYPSDGLTIPDFKTKRCFESEIEQFRFNCERPTWITMDQLDLKPYIYAAVFDIPIVDNSSTIELQEFGTIENNHCHFIISTIKKYYNKPTYTLGLTLIHYYVKSCKLLNVLLRIYREDGKVSFVELSSGTFYEQFETYMGHIIKLRRENLKQIDPTDSIHYPPNGIYLENIPLVSYEFLYNKESFNMINPPIFNHPPSRDKSYISIQKHVVNHTHFRTWLPEISIFQNYSSHKNGFVTNFILQGGHLSNLPKLWNSFNSLCPSQNTDINCMYKNLKNSKVLENYNVSYISCFKYRIPSIVLNSLHCTVILIHLSYEKLYTSFHQYFQTNSERLVVIASDVISYLLNEIKCQSTRLNFEITKTIEEFQHIVIKFNCSVKKNTFYNIMLNFTMKLAKISDERFFLYHIFRESINKFSSIIIEASDTHNTKITIGFIEFCGDWIIDNIKKITNDYEEDKFIAKTKCPDFDETEFNKMFCSVYNLNDYSPDDIINHVMATTKNDVKLLIEEYGKLSHVNPTYRILQPLESNKSVSFMYNVPIKSGPNLYREVASKKNPTINFSKHTIFRRYDNEKLVYLASEENQSEYPLVLFKWEISSVFEYGLVIFLKNN